MLQCIYLALVFVRCIVWIHCVVNVTTPGRRCTTDLTHCMVCLSAEHI